METTIQVIAGLFAIIGGIYAFFKWGLGLVKRVLPRKRTTKDEITYKIPKESIKITPSRDLRGPWWHMGSSSGNPAMQVDGHFTVTNITKYNIRLTAAKMKKPEILGHVHVEDFESDYYGDYPIPPGGTTDMSFHFWIVPPFKKKGESFFADVAILDQFGNEHWIRKIEFKYS